MRIAISAESNNGLDSTIAQHFGRCPYFAFVDIEGNEIKGINILENPFFCRPRSWTGPGFCP
jgi:predicted Fe-Mo cluster-binding NifX family protein